MTRSPSVPIGAKDRARLRELAEGQARLAKSDAMRALYGDWRRHGAFDRAARPMLTVEMWTFADEIIPAMLTCEGERAREIEWVLLRNVIPFTLFGDDTPVRDYFPVSLRKKFVPFGLETRKEDADESGYVGVGYRFEPYLRDLEEDFSLLGPSRYSVDMAATQAEIDELNDIMGDLLPARRVGETLYIGPAESIIERMEMSDLYMAMYDTPELVHKMMDQLIDDYMAYLDMLEERKLILPTSGDEALPQGSYCFTDALPSTGDGLSTRQVWGYMDAEEFNDVSPAMYIEFIVEHYRRVAARFGALSFGCCEAVHGVWDGGVETLPNLKKVTISAWCDQRFMGERLRGRDIVFLRKPTANLLGVGKDLDEDAVRAHFRETAEAASGCRLEITQRDVYLINNTPDKVRRYVQIARECLDKYYK